jgi:hypothetical protein
VERQALITEFGAHLASAQDAQASQPHWLLGYAVEFFVARVDQLFHALGDEAGVESAIRQAYKTYAKPIDIPGVPNIIVEDLVDQAIEDALVTTVLAAHTRIHAK